MMVLFGFLKKFEKVNSLKTKYAIFFQKYLIMAREGMIKMMINLHR